MQHKSKPPPRGERDGGEISGSEDPTDTSPKPAGQLIDEYGHRHSEAVFRNWSPAAIKALGIRRVGGAPDG